MINKSDDEREQYQHDHYDWYSEPFPPVAHPVREAITMGLAAIIAIGGLVWLVMALWRWL